MKNNMRHNHSHDDKHTSKGTEPKKRQDPGYHSPKDESTST